MFVFVTFLCWTDLRCTCTACIIQRYSPLSWAPPRQGFRKYLTPVTSASPPSRLYVVILPWSASQRKSFWSRRCEEKICHAVELWGVKKAAADAGTERDCFYGPSHRCYCGNRNRLASQSCCVILFTASSFGFFGKHVHLFKSLRVSERLSLCCCCFSTFVQPLLTSFLSCVCVGGCGSRALHPPSSAPNTTALQAGWESRQERFPVPQEALP